MYCTLAFFYMYGSTCILKFYYKIMLHYIGSRKVHVAHIVFHVENMNRGLAVAWKYQTSLAKFDI